MQELIAKMKLNIEQKNQHPQSTKIINNNNNNNNISNNGYVNSNSNHHLSSFGYGSSGSSIGSTNGNGYHQQPKLPINSSTTASYHLNYSKFINHTGLTNSTPI
jgi:hypothetical protein